jgi:hypothetical protein
MSSKVFEPIELFKYLKKHKGSNKRIFDENDTMLVATYKESHLNNKIYEFRNQNIFAYYVRIIKNKYNFINAVTGLPQFFPDIQSKPSNDQKITFIDDNFTSLIYEKLLAESYSEERITLPMYFDIKKNYETAYNTYYSFMFMYNLFSNIGFFGTKQSTTLEKILTTIFEETIRDIARGNMNIYIGKTKETKTFEVEDGPKVYEKFRAFFNEYLPAEYNELSKAQIFKMQLAINYLRVQTVDAITISVLQLVLPGLMSNMGKYSKIEWMRPANDLHFKISADGNLVSCCKVFSIQYSDIRPNDKTLYQYNSIIVHYMIDCSTMNCFVKINIIQSKEFELSKLLIKAKLYELNENQKATLIYIYINPNSAPKLPDDSTMDMSMPINNEKIELMVKQQIPKTNSYFGIDSNTEPKILYDFKYDLSFEYYTYIDFLFSQIPNLYIYLQAMNILSSKQQTITDYIVPLTTDNIIQTKLDDRENIFYIHQFDVEGMPYYIPVGKIMTSNINYLIVYMCDLSKIPESIKNKYDSIIREFISWSSSNNFQLIYHTYSQSNTLPVQQISLLTLIIAFESLTNYIVINKSITKNPGIKLISVELKPSNITGLLTYYYSALLQFEKLANYVSQHTPQSSTPQSNTTQKLSTKKSGNTSLRKSRKSQHSNKILSKTETHRTSRMNLWSDDGNLRKSIKRKPKPKYVSTSFSTAEAETKV